MIVTVAGNTTSPDASPLTVTASSGSSTASSTGANVNVPVPLAAPAGIVSVKSGIAAKSSPTVAVSPDTETVTAVSVARTLPFRVAVTVWTTPVASSATRSGDTVNTTLAGIPLGAEPSANIEKWSVTPQVRPGGEPPAGASSSTHTGGSAPSSHRCTCCPAPDAGRHTTAVSPAASGGFGSMSTTASPARKPRGGSISAS